MKDQTRPRSTKAGIALAIWEEFNTEQALSDPVSSTAKRWEPKFAPPTNAESEKGANFVPWSPRLPPTANAIEGSSRCRTPHRDDAAPIDNHGSGAVLFYLCRATSTDPRPKEQQ